jgi:uncharacterized membrane protein YccC
VAKKLRSGFYIALKVGFICFIIFVGASQGAGYLALNLENGLIGALLGVGFVALVAIVIWLCSLYDDR